LALVPVHVRPCTERLSQSFSHEAYILVIKRMD
jgi:hypothetical protein